MFVTLTILVIYLINRSICASATPSITTTTLSFEEQVKKELSPIEADLKNIKDRSTHKEDNIWLKGRIQGKVEKIIERAINAERENNILNQDKGALKKEKEIFSKPLGILSVRSRVETLVDDLYPERRPFHIGVAKAFEEILTSTLPKFADRPCIKIFRERVRSYGISAENFVDTVRSLYGSFSDKAAHKMAAFQPLPPQYNDTEGIKEMLTDFGITADDVKVCAIQIVLQPLPMSK